MNVLRRLCRGWPLVLVLWNCGARSADEYTFDTSQFEKKTFELGGYAQIKQERFEFNRGGAFYKLSEYALSQRGTLDRTTGTLQLVGKWRPGIGTFDFRTNSQVQQDQADSDRQHTIYEAVYSVRPKPGVTLEAGKRALRWGKGYAWSPIAFLERPKDPNDPELAREGFILADGDFIINPGGNLQTIAFTPVLLPVGQDVNSDFGQTGHLNPAAKLYLLYRDTDIDIAWQGKGSRPARFGFDFSRNVTTNFEIHGEWARTRKFTRPVTDSDGRVTNEVANADSYVLGLRYLTQANTTYIAEYYYNGLGYSEQESRQFYQLVDATFRQVDQIATSPLLQRLRTLGQGSYGRPNAGKRYVYFRAQQKDALGIVYFQPAITTMINVDDRSFQVTPELMYTGINNLELRLRFFVLSGGSLTDFGEKQNSRKLEVYARYYF
ncbi:MAG: hypothetical protein ACXWCY_08070 [Burkholderiales bacterium]